MNDKSTWIILDKKALKNEIYFKRQPTPELEFAKSILRLSDEEMKHYVEGSLKEEPTEDGGSKYTGTLRFSFGTSEKPIEEHKE